jgi:hypothetical protein
VGWSLSLYLIADNDLRAISLINSIESLGGSAGYKKNPAAFEGTLPATVSGKDSTVELQSLTLMHLDIRIAKHLLNRAYFRRHYLYLTITHRIYDPP